MAVAVVGDRPVEETRERPARLGLASALRVGHLLLEPERAERGQPALGEPAGDRRQLPRRLEHRPALGSEPVAVKRREHRVGPAVLGLDPAHVDRVQALVGVKGDSALAERRPDALGASPPEGAHLVADVDLLGADLDRQRGQLTLRPAVADHQARAPLAERAIEVGQALEQELGSRPGAVAAAEQAVVEAEDADDRAMALERRPHRRVVADAKIAAKPDERGAQAGSAPPPAAALTAG